MKTRKKNKMKNKNNTANIEGQEMSSLIEELKRRIQSREGSLDNVSRNCIYIDQDEEYRICYRAPCDAGCDQGKHCKCIYNNDWDKKWEDIVCQRAPCELILTDFEAINTILELYDTQNKFSEADSFLTLWICKLESKFPQLNEIFHKIDSLLRSINGIIEQIYLKVDLGERQGLSFLKERFHFHYNRLIIILKRKILSLQVQENIEAEMHRKSLQEIRMMDISLTPQENENEKEK
jgi:hypothetical protein